MPNATVQQETIRKDLKSLIGAWVELKPLPFGQTLERRDKATQMSMEQEVRDGGRRRSKQEQAKFIIDTLNTWSVAYDFKHCIIDHNLEDAQGQKLDFGNPMTLQILDPRVGQEIERYIDELNNEEDEEELQDFIKLHTSSSKEPQIESNSNLPD